MADSAPETPQYDLQALLNAHPLIITVVDPLTHKVVFQNRPSQDRFGPIVNQLCHENIAGCATPCEFCKMPQAVQESRMRSNEMPLPNSDHLLVQWAPVTTSDGSTHVIETITDISGYKREQTRAELLLKKLSDANRDLQHSNEQLRDQSIRDSLTGLFNHSHFQHTLAQMCSQSLRSMRPLSLLFIDLDNFKRINDTYGHATGDQVLKEMGWLLDSQNPPKQGLARTSDIAARYGGEEFALILPDTSMDGALSAAERIRHRVTTLALLPELATLIQPPFPITCSIGIASFPIHAASSHELVAAADTAVYAAKHAGKNCVRMASPAVPKPLVGF
ncbi:MAG: GGDEF domain-containing protein [Nitrospira sp.]